MAVQIQMRRGTASQWQSSNPTLASGEWGLETDTDKFKIGNGTDAWNSITTYSSLGIGTAGGTFAGTVNFGADGTGQDVNFYSLTGGDHMKWDASEEQLIIEGTNGTVALHVTDGDVTIADGDLTVSGDLTINGATTTVSTTNTLVEDSLIELNTGASSNANDLGIVMERGSTGNNAIIAWDESADKFTMGTTTATGASTGDLSITAGTLVADLEGDVTGDVTGNVSGTDATFTGTTTTYVDVVQETGASHTFALSDAGKYIHCTTPSANCTITLPSDATTAFPIGTQMLFSSPHASNKVVFAAGSNASVTSLDDKLTLKGPDGVAAVIKWTTNSWLLFGPLE
jgi:hypothetical protein